MEAVRELDSGVFESYIEMKADPIVGSLEPGIYAGYFDWKDCLSPTGTHTRRITSLKSDTAASIAYPIITPKTHTHTHTVSHETNRGEWCTEMTPLTQKWIQILTNWCSAFPSATLSTRYHYSKVWQMLYVFKNILHYNKRLEALIQGQSQRYFSDSAEL